MARGLDFFIALSSFIASTAENICASTCGLSLEVTKVALIKTALKSILFDNLVQSGNAGDLEARSVEAKANNIDVLLGLEPEKAILDKTSLEALGEYLGAAPAITTDTISETVAPLLNDNQNKTGSFYTPQSLCDSMVQSGLRELESGISAPCSILEPSCGAGSFVLSVFKNIPPSKIKSITVVDRNPLALSITKLLVHFLAFVENTKLPTINYYLDDFILPRNTALTSERYDFIVGNPPFGLSRAGGFDGTELQEIKKRYKEHLSGKPNKYLLFLEQGLNLLNDHGVLSFITPNAWLGIDSGKKFRKRIIESKQLFSITELPKETWRALGVETIVVTLLGTKRTHNSFLLKNEQNKTQQPIGLSLVTNRPIPLHFDKDKEKKLQEICDNGIQLKELRDNFFLAVGIQAYRTGGGTPAQCAETLKTKPFHSKTKESDAWFPYLEGRDVTHYKVQPPSGFIHYGKHLAECPPLERFQRPRVLLREVLGKPPRLLIAAMTTECVIYNRSILEIAPLGKNAEATAEWLCKLLNSEYGSLQIELLGKKSQRSLFPKIVLSDLKDFYIPKHWKELVSLQPLSATIS